jgi:hypothetical protein
MQLDLKYIVDAIKALNAAHEAIRSGTPDQRGAVAAQCIVAAIALEVRIAHTPVQIDAPQMVPASGVLQ